MTLDDYNAEEELLAHNRQLYITLGDLITIYERSGEFFIDGGVFGSAGEWVRTLDDARKIIKARYPNADWENVGW